MSGVEHRIVGDEEGGRRLDRWLRAQFPDLTQGQIEKMLRKGEVRVDGARAKSNTRVEVGQDIRIPPMHVPGEGRLPPKPVPVAATMADDDAEMIRACVIYRDKHVIAINKPPGLASQGGRGQTKHVDGLLDALKFERDDRPRLVHRLDRDTSGVLLLARSGGVAAKLGEMFHSRVTKKVYWAAVAGAPKPARGVIRYGLLKQGGHGPYGQGEKMICIHPDEMKATENAKAARTLYTTIDALAGRAAWVALYPMTGRTHQLRAHMAEIGNPIVGDGKYGTNETVKEHGGYGAQLGGDISRKLHLHARSLILPHPMEPGKTLRITADLPDHMRRTWAAFGWRASDAPEDPFEDAE